MPHCTTPAGQNNSWKKSMSNRFECCLRREPSTWWPRRMGACFAPWFPARERAKSRALGRKSGWLQLKAWARPRRSTPPPLVKSTRWDGVGVTVRAEPVGGSTARSTRWETVPNGFGSRPEKSSASKAPSCVTISTSANIWQMPPPIAAHKPRNAGAGPNRTGLNEVPWQKLSTRWQSIWNHPARPRSWHPSATPIAM